MSSPFHRRPAYDYHFLLRLRGPPQLLPANRADDARPIRVVCLSDTHTLEWPDVPDGDLLIHAGDLCNDGSVRELQAAVDWLRRLPHRHKVVICGNHDSYFDVRSRLDEDRESNNGKSGSSFAAISSSTASIRSLDDLDDNRIDWGDIHYLQHSSVTLSFPISSSSSSSSATATASSSLTVYGAPQVPAIVPFGPEHAFTYPPHHDAWSGTVPPSTDILVTHTPPAHHRDLSPTFSTGCPSLLAESWRVRPALHVFGHVHAAYGAEPVFWDEAQRAWERLCAARRPRAAAFFAASSSWVAYRSLLLGVLRDLVDLSGWVDAARVLVYGVLGVVWVRVWGGENRGGWMVNAACMYGDSGRLGNKPRVFVL
ncbi:hypothetical protein ASPZODRAFT_235822 [Penicilliopsis zonata CBS 506.65]|uniref:Calcineurin-like phosphoesterase domain-containing protein n=1 Tax=Penicilliopsis zonata CBS 506.65 TaxID=1073090 RepID=A0A1L9SU80_9EURO|nr:hypothetical protein ASPZODRAFT_235822 [Penicilliopsis zonata CBS 506.65]OJJ50696.1 hypothetical protein ASPZODRAFT_235822 [Penicilliopsis zonata CBS 506.65]